MFESVAIKSVAVLGAAWLFTVLLRRRSAAARHMVWTAAFAGLLALPVLSVVVPAVGTPSWMGSSVVFQATAPLRSRLGNEVRDARAAADNITTGAAVAVQRMSWRDWLMRAWIAGAAISLAQMVFGWIVILRTRRRARPFPGFHEEGVAILEGPPRSMPMTFGLLRPAILLPADAAEWSGDRLRLVLLHELAHVRRGDSASHLLARAALSLYWWNPLAWMAWRGFVRERERAADDMVLRGGARASEYAGHLLDIARQMQPAPALGWAAVAMARRSQLEGRLLAILDSDVNRHTPRRGTVWLAAIATIGLIAPLAALRAQDAQTVPADVDATIRSAAAQKNHELLDSAAKAAEAFRQYDVAKKLLDSSLAIRAEVSGQQSADYGVGLLKLGDLERGRHNYDEAAAFYTKAVAVFGDRPEAAPALIDLGLMALLLNKNPQQAYEYFQRAQIPDPSKASPSLMWMAVVRDRQNDPSGAEALFKQALAAEDPDSADAATTMEVYAAFLDRQSRGEEAKTLTAQALVLRRTEAKVAEYRQTPNVSRFRVGPGVTPPTLAYKVEPEYSEEARAAKYQGTVVVAVTVGADGTAQNMQVTRGLGLGLDEKALQAISQWKFKPGTKDGQPAPVMATIEVNFRLL